MIQRYQYLVSFVKPALNKPFVRFLLVSGLNAGFGYGLFALLLYFGLKYEVALLISTVCGISFNFKTIGTFVFGSHDYFLIFKFLAVYSVIYLVNVMGIKVMKSFGINVYIGAAILLLPVGLLSYILNKKFVFKKKETH